MKNVAASVRTRLSNLGKNSTPVLKGLPVALTPEFGSYPGKLTQWSAFLRKNDRKADSGVDRIPALRFRHLNQGNLGLQIQAPHARWKPNKTYYLGKMKKFRDSRFSIKQAPSLFILAYFKTYFQRKTPKFSVSGFFEEVGKSQWNHTNGPIRP